MSYVAIIAARGRSGRTGLGEYTTKAALSIGERTLLQHQLDFLVRSKVARVLVIVRPEHVRLLASQLSDEERRRVAFIVSDADCESGWAGTVACAEDFVDQDDEVLLISCDNLHAGVARRLGEVSDVMATSLNVLFTYTHWSRSDASPTQGPIFARGDDGWEERSGSGYIGDFFSGYAVVRGGCLFDTLRTLRPSPRGEREFTSLLRALHAAGRCASVPYDGIYEDVADLAAVSRYHARSKGSPLWQETPTIGAGIVLHDGSSVFMTERADGFGWVFPGGVCDADESFVETAIREVHEEVGALFTAQSLRLLGVYPTLGKRGEPACSVIFHADVSRRLFRPRFDQKEVAGAGWFSCEEINVLIIPFDMAIAATDYFANRELDVR